MLAKLTPELGDKMVGYTCLFAAGFLFAMMTMGG